MNTKDQEHASAILNALYQLTQADGQVSQDEKAWLNQLLQNSGLDKMPSMQLLSFDRLREAVPEHEERLKLIEFMFMVSLVDGQTTPEETAFIDLVAQELEVSPEQVEELRQTTVLAVDA